MKIGVVADDFTGASDIASTLSEGGLRVVQYIGPPPGRAEPDVDCGVVALKIRTAPTPRAVAEAVAACDWLLSQGCGQIVYKVCSTFDSTPDGNIGPVAAALADRLGETTVVVCPAFPENGRSVYQGHLFVADRLLSETGMRHHPLTPMDDPDIRRVLGRQTSWPVAHVAIDTVLSGRGAIARALDASGHAMVVVDAIRDADLEAIGRAAAGRRLLVGGSGIAMGLPANVGVGDVAEAWAGVPGPGIVLSGSCSEATRDQIAAYRHEAPSRQLDIDAIMEGRYDLEELQRWVLAQSGVPIVYSSADPAEVAASQRRHGRENCAAAIERTFSSLAARLADAGVTRIVVAGGETSGAVVSGLHARALRIGPRIAPGIPAVRVENRNLALALKSGNFGQRDVFSRALRMLEGRP